MTTQKLTDDDLVFLSDFVSKNPDFKVSYFGMEFTPKIHLGAKKIWFVPSDTYKNIFEENSFHPDLFNQLIAASGLNKVTEDAIADKPTFDYRSVPNIPLSVTRIDGIDRRVTDIEHRLDHGYSPLISDLRKEILRLKDVIKQCCISNIEKAVETEQKTYITPKTFFWISHQGKRVKAWWKEELSKFYLFLESDQDYSLSEKPSLDDLYCFGKVSIDRNPAWSDDTFINVSRIAIKAFLDGRSGSELF